MSDSPKRVQLRRTKGWRKPEGAVVVSRPSKWGNPYRLHGRRHVQEPLRSLRYCAPGEQRGVALRLFREDLMSGRGFWVGFTVEDVRTELAGKDLACWCPIGEPCHGDLLLAIANDEETAA